MIFDGVGADPLSIARCTLLAMKSAIFQKIVLLTSVVWGVVMLGVGGLASFTVTSTDTPLTRTGFALVFILPFVASIAALRMARVAGTVLLLSVVAALCCLSQSWSDVLQILSRIILWPHILFGVLFLAVSRIHGPSDTVAGAEPKS